MRRREMLIQLAGTAALAAGHSKAQDTKPSVTWHDVAAWRIDGRGWKDVASPFDRLPARAQKTVRKPVWSLSRHSAGLNVRFETDASEVHAQWTLLSKSLAMPHMPATGVSGVDLYAWDGSRWRWAAIGRPGGQESRARLVAGLPKATRKYTLYLPLYNGVTALSIGTTPGAMLRPLPPRKTKPVVVYGTSIVQGGCASRPGMVYTSILSRRLDREFINLGFSGNGTLDTSVADLLAELDPAAYVIDCLPNITAPQITERTAPLVQTLRKARPTAPIVLVEDRDYANGWLIAGRRKRNRESQAALRKEYEKLRAAGMKGLHYVPGKDLLGDDSEATVDSSHPTDLGFMRMADTLEPMLRPLV